MAALTIALDAMGGDIGPDTVVPGAESVGHSSSRKPVLCCLATVSGSNLSSPASPISSRAAEVRHTDVLVAMDDKPSQALRQRARESIDVAGRSRR